ncbi:MULTISPECIES: carboxymuconolactone decarboxylase family protein [Sphingobium]|jgi:4-carboxymuconolactone decarboxylase|uniref:4-carboxymuconolactone decarboxylase n=2 Tax=Sphingobium fuliginis (strain ATCC 27551) TaxID=336203 RepID=A0A292ZNI6_SPHSA|nr:MULTISPECIES: carboxymuconolactone decarboxylase family protein [Sphingobium]OAP29421.1 carboxymuconolactone decarboxylase [Sphingobium sp. 20006FA]AJR23308.1 carboxymuconolactone decarboxylase [Sphingobium sp. YBL2]KXU33171.1 carboxymuconolactone decarboxylase [Sphingobium sp. AM]KYC29840.1 carboxymuconolactone decarboxylase [Sphingobium sp. 22B]MCB4862308.1 carboxymuconolactone decarboxylase family protein [Sphingobium sp. PNB]
MAELDEKQKSGVDFISGIMGEGFGNAFREACTADRFGSPIPRMAASWAFHDAWQHQGLAPREKSMAVISALIAMRQSLELKNHVKIGIANGLTAQELEGLLVQLTPYVGFPCIASATTAVIEAMREAGVSPDVQTAEEKGLL